MPRFVIVPVTDPEVETIDVVQWGPEPYADPRADSPPEHTPRHVELGIPVPEDDTLQEDIERLCEIVEVALDLTPAGKARLARLRARFYLDDEPHGTWTCPDCGRELPADHRRCDHE